jgi:hypothetical protein
MSAAAAEQETETQSPNVVFDPLMSAPAPASSAGKSFSDMDELPPMKELVFAPPPPPLPVPEVSDPPQLAQFRRQEEKPQVQPREVAEKAIKEIKTVPPQLMISPSWRNRSHLVVAVAVYFHVHQRRRHDSYSRPTKATTSQPVAPSPAPAPVVTQAGRFHRLSSRSPK